MGRAPGGRGGGSWIQFRGAKVRRRKRSIHTKCGIPDSFRIVPKWFWVVLGLGHVLWDGGGSVLCFCCSPRLNQPCGGEVF